jgi:hypothetical protein
MNSHSLAYHPILIRSGITQEKKAVRTTKATTTNLRSVLILDIDISTTFRTNLVDMTPKSRLRMIDFTLRINTWIYSRVNAES